MLQLLPFFAVADSKGVFQHFRRMNLEWICERERERERVKGRDRECSEGLSLYKGPWEVDHVVNTKDIEPKHGTKNGSMEPFLFLYIILLKMKQIL